MANTYTEKFTQGEMQTKQRDTIWTVTITKAAAAGSMSVPPSSAVG